MLSATIMGGLGNQLFIIFATLAYGIQNNIKVVFPYTYHLYDRHTYWETLLDEIRIFTLANESNNDYHTASFHQYSEPRFRYDVIPDFGGIDITFHGYFQSYKYFEKVQSTIYSMIKLSRKQEHIREKYSNYLGKTGPTDILSIHFRLGDYKYKRNYHPIMNYEYFEGALDYIMLQRSNRENAVRVLYFCEQEDNAYVGSKIALLNQKYPGVEFLKVDDTIEDYEQVLIMSCCDHHIIPNSTFSWWGAYLNQSNSKIVCYPSVWFNAHFESYEDIIPPTWIKIVAEPTHHDLPLV